jgi:hypothetical protein
MGVEARRSMMRPQFIRRLQSADDLAIALV